MLDRGAYIAIQAAEIVIDYWTPFTLITISLVVSQIYHDCNVGLLLEWHLCHM